MSDVIILVFLVVCLIGYIQTIRQAFSLVGKLYFVHQFYEAFQRYYRSKGADKTTYNWLMQHSEPMQWTTGDAGILEIYRPPSGKHFFKNVPIFINLIPELRDCFETPHHDRNAEPVARHIDNALLRFIGVLKDLRREALFSLLNPVLWVRQGVRAILGFPIFLLQWLGLISTESAARARNHIIFSLLERIFAIVGITATTVGLIVDWKPFTEIAERVLHLTP